MGAPYTLHGKQKQFLLSPSKRLAFFGGIRAGKTIAGDLRVLTIAHEYPGSRILVGRQALTDLLKTTVRELEDIVKSINNGHLEPGPLIIKYNRSTSGTEAMSMQIRSKDPENPSTIVYGYADNLPALLGSEYSAIYFDQVEGIDQDIFIHASSRLSYWNRTRSAEFEQRYGYKPKDFFFVTGNPDPGWVYEFFKLGSEQNGWDFLEISTKENIENLPEGYLEEQTKGKPELWVKRWLEGSWDIRGGQVYAEFDESIHCCNPFKIPEHWPRFVAMDWGYRHNAAAYWAAVGEDGIIYVYREYSDSKKLASVVAKTLNDMSIGDPCRKWNNQLEVYMPSDMWQHRGQVNHTVADEFAQHGIQGIQANRAVEAGILRIQERLHPVNGDVGLKIFKGYCPKLVRGMKIYSADEATGKPIKKEDDEVDALRYLVMAILDSKAIKLIEKKSVDDIMHDHVVAQFFSHTSKSEKEYL